MPSSTEICNRALSFIGAKRIGNITDTNSENARVCNELWEMVVKEILAEHEWQCAIKRRSLAADAATPDGDEFDYQYTLPNDCLRVLEIFENENAVWEIEGEMLLTSESTVTIRYIFYQSDEATYSPGLVQYISMKMAHELSQRLSGKNAVVDRALRAMEVARIRGKGSDAMGKSERIRGESSTTAWHNVGR